MRCHANASVINMVRKSGLAGGLSIAGMLLGAAMVHESAIAAVTVARPPRVADTSQPLELRLIFSADEGRTEQFDIPPEITVKLSNGDIPPVAVRLMRANDGPPTVSLVAGQSQTVVYRAAWPDWLRGTVQIDVAGYDVSPAMVALKRSGKDVSVATAPAQASATSQTALPALPEEAPATTTLAQASNAAGQTAMFSNRLSTYEPIYFADGSNGANLAKFQISFKFRMTLADDPKSTAFFDNLYFAYTQTSLWDIREESAPFHDTSYKPAVFYYVADTGWKSESFSRMGFMGGLEHESNGRDGPESRGVDIAFVRPIWEFGDLSGRYLTVAPKIYYYLIKHQNPDIPDYRGYVDLLVKYGSDDGMQVGATFRKGTRSWYGSVDSQLTYPLAKIFGNGWGGYLWLGYFYGYGEDILDYNKKRWIARIGLALSR